MGLMFTPFQMLCFVQLFMFQQNLRTSHQLPSGVAILHLEQCVPGIFEGMVACHNGLKRKSPFVLTPGVNGLLHGYIL